jgi:pseudouridine-5'-phosphate glycosidase
VREPFALAVPVRLALGEGRPVVALETSVLAQGLPHPRNLEARDRIAAAVVAAGAMPAWTALDAGQVVVGAEDDVLERLCDGGAADGPPAVKVARRDIPMAVATGLLGGTTVSATLWAAARAGIEVTATGGIGGVHPGTGDVSADLLELARLPGTVVCSGPKSIVDPYATLEKLEELGVGMLGYGVSNLPFFLVREIDLPLEHRVDSPEEAASAARARRDLRVESSLLVCNPVPPEHALDRETVAVAVRACIARAESEGITGKAVTPYLLSCLSERTGGASLEANLALLEANAGLAGAIAAALS